MLDERASRPHLASMAARGGERVTTDHEFIRDWVERRGGCPASASRGRRGKVEICYSARARKGPPALLPMGWDEFFDWFEKHKLAFLYREAPRGSGAAKLIERSTVLVPVRRRR
jgi:hypothetical protein